LLLLTKAFTFEWLKKNFGNIGRLTYLCPIFNV